jgi:ATP-binding cassette, subfamily B, bacterial PglK
MQDSIAGGSPLCRGRIDCRLEQQGKGSKLATTPQPLPLGCPPGHRRIPLQIHHFRYALSKRSCQTTPGVTPPHCWAIALVPRVTALLGSFTVPPATAEPTTSSDRDTQRADRRCVGNRPRAALRMVSCAEGRVIAGPSCDSGHAASGTNEIEHGIRLEIRLTPKIVDGQPPIITMIQTLQAILKLLSRRERWQLLLIFLIMLPNALMQVAGIASVMPFIAVLAQPELVERNALISSAHALMGSPPLEQFLIVLAAGALVLLFLGNGLAALTTWIIIRFSYMRTHTLSRKLLGTYLDQDYGFFLNRNPSDLSKNVIQEVNELVSGFLIPVLQVAANAAVVAAILAMLILVDPMLAVTVGLLLGGAYAFIYWGFRRRVRRLGQLRLKANARRFKTVHEAFGAIKDIKVSNREDYYLGTYAGASYAFARNQASHALISQLPRYALETIAFGIVLLIALYLVTAGDSMEKALPMIALYAMAGYRLMPGLQKLFDMTARMRFSGPVVERINSEMERLHTAHPVKLPSNPKDLTGESTELHLNDRLELQSITFRYPGMDRPVLDRLDLSIKARTSVAFVGGSGAGKSTLVDIILGLLEPESGRLMVDGQVLTREDLPYWRRRLGYVPQAIYLSDDTLRRNIALGIPDRRIDDQAMIRAAKTAAIHDFIVNELPGGYDTFAGDRGIRLSGGQRQRIGIARALYHNPDLLILDEATSALDGATEAAVMEAIERLSGEKTVIMIAHRLATVRNCNVLYLLDKGRIVASGTYDQLMAGEPAFRRMAQAGHAAP